MRDLHSNIQNTAVEVTVKENQAFRVRMEKWESVIPGLYSLDIIQECLDDKGEVNFSSVYSFNMTQEELRFLAAGLLA